MELIKMANSFFRFKQFTVQQDACAMKVTTDACLFGAWCAHELTKDYFKNGLDIGTGTGLLSLMICQKNEVVMDAVEIERAASEQAKENIGSSPFLKNIHIIYGDVLNLPVANYDCIICNPPFYEKELPSPDMAKSRARHGGSLTWKKLFLTIRNSLAEKGKFYLLLPYKRIDEVRTLPEEYGLYIHQLIPVRSSFAHAPFRIMVWGSKKKSETIIMTELSIRGDTKEYTPEFIQLLKDYYLYL